MSEISILLKDIQHMTLPEYKALDRYSSQGRTWSIITKEHYTSIKHRSVEYIFEPENYILFKLASPNVLYHWFTDNTRHLRLGETYQLGFNLYIRLHSFGF